MAGSEIVRETLAESEHELASRLAAADVPRVLRHEPEKDGAALGALHIRKGGCRSRARVEQLLTENRTLKTWLHAAATPHGYPTHRLLDVPPVVSQSGHDWGE